ncbi:MAG: glycerophosphodiester phosphodiesterase, partial [Myxococcota bacterium]|nr:glycerophosphodiester phosphodiesterase [Myxococcota bacterium]
MRGFSFLLIPIVSGCSRAPAAPEPASTADSGAFDSGPEGAGPFSGHTLLEPGRVYNTAHRGGAALWPEHSLLAFQGASDVGADVLEVDIHATEDGRIVVIHDATVDRTTDGTGAVKAMDFDTLRALDAAYRFSPDGGQTHPHRGQGVQVPTLEEVLTAHPEALFNIEIKQQSPSIVAETVALIEAAGLEDQVVLSSFHDHVTREVRASAPSMLTALGTIEGMDLYSLQPDNEAAYAPPSPFFAAPVEYAGLEMTRELIDKAHRVGVRVHAW